MVFNASSGQAYRWGNLWARLRRGRFRAMERPDDGEEAWGARLVAGLVHDLNSPIGALASSASTLRGLVDRLESPEPIDRLSSQKQLETLRNLTSLQLETTHRLRDTLRALEGFVDLDRAERREVDLAQSIQAALGLVTPSVDEGVCIVVRIPPTTPRPITDARRLHRALLHVLDHAVESARKGDTIRIEAGPLGGDKVRIRVIQASSTVSPQELSHLFHPKLAPRGSSVRLDLSWATTRRTISALGGTIGVESGDGWGTTVSVDLPLHSPPTAGSCEKTGSVPSPPMRARIARKGRRRGRLLMAALVVAASAHPRPILQAETPEAFDEQPPVTRLTEAPGAGEAGADGPPAAPAQRQDM